MDSEEQEVRPRFGAVIRANGDTAPVYYLPHEDEEDTFVALDPATDETIELGPGDTLKFDAIEPHQTVLVIKSGGETRGRTKSGWKEYTMPENAPKEKDPNAWWKGLVTLAGLCAIVVLTIAGVNWAWSL